MSRPEISIVMPVYNAEQFVAGAVQSLLGQSYGDFELIVVDDGSVDQSLEIISGFEDKRIKVLKNDSNRGIVFSRNRGLAEIKGNYYAPFDADDVAGKDKFEKQVDFMKKNQDFAMTGSWANLMDENGKQLSKKWQLNALPEMIPSIMLFRNYFVHSSLLVRRNMLPEGFYQTGLDVVEDYRFCADMALRHKVYNYPEYLVNYRIHSQSAMRSNVERMMEQDKKIYLYLFDLLKINLSDSDLSCIFALKNANKIDDFSQLRAIHALLIKVLNQNRLLMIFDQKQLQKAIVQRWIKACYLARGHHAKLLSLITSSPLTKQLFRI